MRLTVRSFATAAFAAFIGFAGSHASAQDQEQAMFGSWKVQKDGTALEMYASNDNGATLGVMCVDGQSCAMYVATRVRCEEGASYAGVVGADSGFGDFSLTCKIVGTRYVYVLQDFERAIAGLRNSRQWGLALTTANGKSQSFRFSVSGTADAVGAMARIDHGTSDSARVEARYSPI